jgi:hypothetical protein
MTAKLWKLYDKLFHMIYDGLFPYSVICCNFDSEQLEFRAIWGRPRFRTYEQANAAIGKYDGFEDGIVSYGVSSFKPEIDQLVGLKSEDGCEIITLAKHVTRMN